MEIDNKKIDKWIKENKEFHLLDVRRDDERELCSLGGIHIPLHDLEKRYNELPHDKLPLIVYCHHGVRSLYATQFLKFHGYDALSLRGGIDAWSEEIDPNVPRY
jgi:rhodanese-related sulfurtransferase